MARSGPRIGALSLAAWIALTGVAVASFTSAPSPPAMTISSATIAAPASLTAVRGLCVPLTSRTVELSWAASSSSFTDGYEVFRSTTNGGPYTSIATVGLLTIYTDATVAHSTTYYYVVKSMKSLWRSAASPQASVTTPNNLCV